MADRKRVAELEGAELALWVARIEGVETPGGRNLYASGPCLYVETPWGGGEPFGYRPDSRWSDGGPIIEREKIVLMPTPEGWEAIKSLPGMTLVRAQAATPLVAAMRAFVASKFGETVEVQP